MRKSIIVSIMALLLLGGAMTTGKAQSGNPQKRQTIVFYNVENLFDTIKDPAVWDDEFTPSGPKQWNSAKYWKKIANLEKVFYAIAEENKQFPIVIGVSEVENRNVLEDVAATEKLMPANYQIVHYDSPERRGVDVAFFYRPDQFKYEGSFPEPTVVEELPDFLTRDILTMWGTIDEEPFFFMVAHWPSRSGGQMASEFKRIGAAKTMRRIADSVLMLRPETKIVMMGDLNDDPSDPSIAHYLGARQHKDEVGTGPGQFFNPFFQMHKEGYGTLAYQDAWNLFDNIIVSGNLINDTGGYQLWRNPKNKFYGNIFDRPFMRQKSGQYKGYPLRTYAGNKFQDGFSDHFPVYIFIAR